MLIDLHAHTSGISTCCRVPAPDILKAAKDIGLDGIALTNHYQKIYVKEDGAAAFARRYVDEYHYTKSCAEGTGLRVFYGMEITMEQHSGAHILVYGVDPDFTLHYPDVYNLTLAQLYLLVHENGGMLVQAHPFRRGKNMLQDLSFLDGVEANSHQIYDATHFVRLTDIAHSRGLILTSGGDYHADTPRPHCGTYLPDTVSDEKTLREFLCTTPCVDLQIQEPHAPESQRVTYCRHS